MIWRKHVNKSKGETIKSPQVWSKTQVWVSWRHLCTHVQMCTYFELYLFAQRWVMMIFIHALILRSDIFIPYYHIWLHSYKQLLYAFSAVNRCQANSLFIYFHRPANTFSHEHVSLCSEFHRMPHIEVYAWHHSVHPWLKGPVNDATNGCI